MKTQDLTILVSPDVNGVAHFYLLEGYVSEKLFRRGGVVVTDGAIALRGSDCFGGAFFGCVHPCLMSGLTLVIMLLHAITAIKYRSVWSLSCL